MTRLSAIHTIIAKILLCASLFMVLGIFCNAQQNPNLDNGLDPYGSYHGGDIDSISVINGGLTLHAPVSSYSQRGSLSVDFFLVANSKNWGVSWIPPKTQSGTGYYQWTTSNLVTPPGVVLENSLQLQLQRQRVIESAGGNTFVAVGAPTLITPDGSSHRLTTISCTPSCTQGITNSAIMETADTTGYQVTMYYSHTYEDTGDEAVVVDRKGNRYTLNFATTQGSFQTYGQGRQTYTQQGQGQYTDLFTTTSVTDVDGNTVQLAQTFYGPNGQIDILKAGVTDTLGRSLMSYVSGDPTTSEQYASPTFGGSTSSFQAAYTQENLQTAFNQPSIYEGSEPGSASGTAPYLMTSFSLANQTAWAFTYDQYGDLSSITLPTGAKISYTWQTVPLCPYSGSYTKVSRAVQTRTISGPGIPTATWTYTFGAQQSDWTMHNVVTDADGNDTVHVITPLGGQYSCSFYETQTIYYQGSQSANNVLKTVNTGYYYQTGATLGYPDDSEILVNVYPQTITTILPNGNTSQNVTTEDSGVATTLPGYSAILGDVVNIKDYDYGQGSAGPLIRQTSTSYAWQQSSGNPNYAAFLAANILDPLVSVQVQDSSGSRCSETDNLYDEPAYLTTTNFGTPYQHGSAPNSVRGNATTTTYWLAPLAPSTTSCQLPQGTSWSSFVTHTNWYDTGVVYKKTDARGNVTMYSYDPFYWGAFQTETTNAIGQVVSGTYDFNTGLITSVTDVNGSSPASGNTPGDPAHTSTYTFDNMFRILQANTPNGGKVTFKYNDTPGSLSVTKTSLQTAPNTVITTTVSFDDLGRKVTSSLLDPEGTDVSVFAYDALGRVSQTYNPTRNWSSSTPSTQNQYDALGRPTLTKMQDGSIINTIYNSNCTTVIDEAGFVRQSCTDALGHVIEADEPNVASPGVPATANATISGSLQSTQSSSVIVPASNSPISIANYLVNNTDDIYTVGSNGHIYEFTDASGTWQSNDITGSTTGAPAAASGSSLASTYNSSTGQTTVYFVASDQHLHAIWRSNSGTWATVDISAQSANSGTSNILTNSPISAYVAQNSEWVSVIGTNENAYQMTDSSGAWKATNLTWAGAPGAASGSSIANSFNPNDWDTSAYYVGNDSHLHRVSCCPNNGNWGTTDITTSSWVSGSSNTLGSSPISIANYLTNNFDLLFTIGTNQHVYSYQDSSPTSAWSSMDVSGYTGAPSAASGSQVASSFNPSDWTTSVYYVGTDQHLHNLRCCSNGNWLTTDITSATSSSGTANTLSASPISIANYLTNNSDSLFAIGTNQHIYSYGDSSPTSSWGAFDVTAYTGAPSAISGSALASSFNPNTWKTNAYYIGSDQHLHLLMCCESGNWTSLDLSAATAGAEDSGTVSLTLGGFTATACYGNSNNPVCSGQTRAYDSTDVAEALVAALNNNSNSPATATLTGSSTIKLTWKTGGENITTVNPLNTTHDNPSAFPSASFTSASTSFGGGQNSTIDSTAYATKYQYDPHGNLICVEQHGNVTNSSGCSAASTNDATSQWRIRRRSYDSLSRMLQMTNPESGTISYQYDNNGNLISKTDARGITINYNPADMPIDPLNRVLKKTYSDGEIPVTFTYDTGMNGKGHRTGASDAAGSSALTYDVMGHLIAEQRTTASISQTVQYAYYLDGELQTLVYPSGHTLTFKPSYAGRLLSITDATNGINYISNATYAPDGQPSGYLSGNSSTFGGFKNAFTYNSRLQMASMSAVSPTQTILNLSYDLHVGSGDNGDIWGIANNKDTTGDRNQLFTYDQLNRLASGQNAGTDCSQTVSNGMTKYWGSSYAYDPWGNLLTKSPTKCNSETLSQAVGVNNQISGNSAAYDAAGNMTNSSGVSYSYNAEGQVSSAAGYSYLYDADGNRVAKLGASSMLYWHSAQGILAETDSSGNPLHEYVFSGGTRIARRDVSGNTYGAPYYYFSNHIQSTSVIADASGTIQAESDYYPWGGELPITANITFSHKFTGKERDTETGNDHFGARYYGNAIGRFTSPDPAMQSANGLNPQTWNRYSYVTNNPTQYLDPFGLWDIQYKVVMDARGNIRIQIMAKKSQPGDDAASLARQLGFKDDKGLIAAIDQALNAGGSGSGSGSDDKEKGVQPAKLGGIVGRTFGTAEYGLSRQQNYARKPKKGQGGPEDLMYNDCSMTAMRIAAPSEMLNVRGTGNWNGVLQADQMISDLKLTNVTHGAERTGDIIHWSGGNLGEHFATVLFTGDDGTVEVFSRSGESGPFEHLPITDKAFKDYGTITGEFRPKE